ncbi:MAG: bi-domain-containing oxidoreductase [Gammaproteobacteria bacterium]|nr:bi-domain-containing oxidoreductase [Gammaproteobacteria bacterium]
MKQILQHLGNGTTEIADIPCPSVKPGHLLIRSTVSLLSVGTERMLLEFGKASLINKARQQPDKVRMVLDKIKTDGLLPAITTIRNKLDQPIPMGYCNAGIVLEVGKGVEGFKVGDRVASNGKHAEVTMVSKHLCARIPDTVSDEHATFTVMSAIALQGIRLAAPTLGESVVVTGLGLIGLLTVQLLRAQGCRVLGLDFDQDKLRLARAFGVDTVDLSIGQDPLMTAQEFSRQRGVDAVIITASTQSNEPIHQAAQMCRKRGRIVLVGVAGLELSRADFFEKELTFQVSCSYGPGRYDPAYEEAGQDYPVGYVRWTEQRNFEAILDMLADKRLQTDRLITHRFAFENATDAYALVSDGRFSLGILLEYPSAKQSPELPLREQTLRLHVEKPHTVAPPSGVVIGFIGSGNYASQVLIPAFKATGAMLQTVASSLGVSGVHAGRKYGFYKITTDATEIFNDTAINTAVITTRHDNHAHMVCEALNAGKHVFVEKPLAITPAQLDEIIIAYQQTRTHENPPLLMVGFNRRFAPQIQKMQMLLQGVSEPKVFVMTVNAGMIPSQHWTQDRDIGGGRIIGEACHFIDLLRYLAGAEVVNRGAMILGPNAGYGIRDDKMTITLQFAEGSMGTVHYLANGHKSFPKERLEVFCAGRILQLDNFRRLRGYGWPKFTSMTLWRQDKGQKACAQSFVNAVSQGQPSPISFTELIEVSRLSLALANPL